MSHEAAAHAADPHHHDAGHASHPHVNYLSIFIALCVCTALSVLFDIVPMNHKLVVVLVLAVAVAKAQYVMRYFMHLKFEGLWKYVLLLPTAILATGLPLALAPDIAMHYYTPEYAALGEEPEQPGRSEHGHAPQTGEQSPSQHTPPHE
jgi:cytochrome c oxidase subunit 4